MRASNQLNFWLLAHGLDSWQVSASCAFRVQRWLFRVGRDGLRVCQTRNKKTCPGCRIYLVRVALLCLCELATVTCETGHATLGT